MKTASNRPTVLAVNDEPQVLELLGMLLEHEGYRVITASNGRRALELAVTLEPDIVISDVVMPEMDGLEFCRRLKQDQRTAYVPVLLASAVRRGERDSVHGLTAGADDYLEMPFRKQELLVKVARLTERHRVERHYRETVEQAPDIIYTRDMQGVIMSINAAGARFFGRPVSELVGLSMSALFGEDAAAEDLTEMEEGADATPSRSVYSLTDAQGTEHYLEGAVTLVRDGQGKPTGVRGVVRDITERRRAEEALRESQRMLSTLMSNLPGMAYRCRNDPDWTMEFASEGALELTGYPSERLTGGHLSYAELIHPDERERVWDDVQVALKENRPFQLVYRIRTATGDERWVWENGRGVLSPEGELLALEGFITDITERKRAEERIEQQAEREAVINRISRAVRRSLNPAEVFSAAVQELGSYLSVDRCALFMKDEQAGRVRMLAEYHSPGVRPAERDFELSRLRDLIEGIKLHGALAFDDVVNDDRIHLYNEFLRAGGVRSIMCVAIKVGGEMPGIFALSTTRGVRRWQETDIALARAVADQTGIAIRQAELYQKAEATSAREALINRLSLAIRASLSLPEVISTATRELGRALEASRVHLYLYDPSHMRTRAEYEYVAPHSSSIKHIEVSFDDAVGHRLLRASEPIVINDALGYAQDSPEFNAQVRAYAARVHLRSQIDCPLVVNGRFRGVLCIHQTDRVRRWTEDDIALVEAVAAQLATGIAQAELFEMTGRAKNEWETTFNAMSDGIFIFDNDGQLIRVNRAGAAMEDTLPHFLLGRHCCDILRTSGDKTCIVEKTIAESRSVTVEIAPERFNRPLLVTAEPVMENGSRTIGAVCTARDLSELRKIEAEAREHQSLLTNILESARESIYAVDTQGRFQWCNSATLAATGFMAEDLIGQSFLNIIHEADHETAREGFTRTLEGRPQVYEVRFIGRGGNIRHALFDSAPLVVDGRTTGVLGIGRDITEQKQERQRAAQADKLRALGQLASGVAHDFNNALTAIIGRTQLMRRHIEDRTVRQNLDVIQTAAEDAAATVRRIQTFARQSPVKEFELLNAGDLLRDAIEITRTRWENEARLRGLYYEVELQFDCPFYLSGNASELREVFVNLIVNAVDAMPQGGRLSITCQRKADRLRLRFSDTGTGMPEDVRERIFEPFYTTKGAQGTGLGLAVSYGIIERHEGQINVESEVARGTTFEIDLPAADESVVPASKETEEIEESPFSVLVIDDEPLVRETLAEMLAALGHRATAVGGGHEALAAMARESFDLVFTDLAMPEMDGSEVAREIRRRWPATNIILVTGYGTGALIPAGSRELFNGIIGKPFDFDQISKTIARVAAEMRSGGKTAAAN
ncbi:MAG TPA: PAS domain S-box protein [Pyrinomonadaceae bacterium]|jgi:PAS domain S-box-containing protein